VIRKREEVLSVPEKTEGKHGIIFLITESRYFWFHYLPLVRATNDAGFEVCVVTPPSEFRRRIESEGFFYHLSRSGSNTMPHKVIAPVLGIL